MIKLHNHFLLEIIKELNIYADKHDLYCEINKKQKKEGVREYLLIKKSKLVSKILIQNDDISFAFCKIDQDHLEGLSSVMLKALYSFFPDVMGACSFVGAKLRPTSHATLVLNSLPFVVEGGGGEFCYLSVGTSKTHTKLLLTRGVIRDKILNMVEVGKILNDEGGGVDA